MTKKTVLAWGFERNEDGSYTVLEEQDTLENWVEVDKTENLFQYLEGLTTEEKEEEEEEERNG